MEGFDQENDRIVAALHAVLNGQDPSLHQYSLETRLFLYLVAPMANQILEATRKAHPSLDLVPEKLCQVIVACVYLNLSKWSNDSAWWQKP